MAHFAQSPYFVLHQLTCQFADGETLFGPLDLAFDRSRCGPVGRNGVGKTQLLRLIAGRDRPGIGHVESHAVLAYVAQQPESAVNTTLAQLLGYGESSPRWRASSWGGRWRTTSNVWKGAGISTIACKAPLPPPGCRPSSRCESQAH